MAAEPRQGLPSLPVRHWVLGMGGLGLGFALACAQVPPAPVALAPQPAVVVIPERVIQPELDPPAVAPAPEPIPEEPASLVQPEALLLAQRVLRAQAPQLSVEDQAAIAELLYQAEAEHGIPVLTALGLIQQESRFAPRARGPRGSLGLMQIRPFVGADIAKRHGLEWQDHATLYHPVKNVRMGLIYLAEQRERFGTTELALAAYNVGPTRLRRLLASGRSGKGRYVRHVLQKADTLAAEYASAETAAGG